MIQIHRLTRLHGLLLGALKRHATRISPPPKQSFARYGITKWNLVTREEKDYAKFFDE